MQKQRWRFGLTLLLVVGLALVGLAGGQANADAEQAGSSASTHYKVDDVQFGSGSTQHCSTNYCSTSSLGDTVVGNASSANYSAQFGSNTDNVPLLEVITDASPTDLGVFDVDHTSTTSNHIKVRTYLSNGYVIQVTGLAPNQGRYTMQNLTQPSTSHEGAEQFGINLVANTAPEVGANPTQIPNGDFSHGVVADDYKTANLFKYINGDIVATSSTGTGETDYTMSVIFNVSNTTPAGYYKTTLSAVVTPAF